ncbi:MAG: 30S ribosomal protein S16 [Phycisphaerales bacterium]
MVRIRLKRMGRRNRPFYRINAIEKRNKRDGKVLENLGWYDPIAAEGKQYLLKEERIKHWLSQGAQGTDTVNGLLAKAKLIDSDKWAAFIKERNERRAAARAKAAAAAPAKDARKK